MIVYTDYHYCFLAYTCQLSKTIMEDNPDHHLLRPCAAGELCCAPWLISQAAVNHVCKVCGGKMHSFCIGAKESSISKTCAKCIGHYINEERVLPIAHTWYKKDE